MTGVDRVNAIAGQKRFKRPPVHADPAMRAAQVNTSNQDVWLRLARLDECCTVDLSSFHAAGTTRTRRWRMTITRRDDSAPPIVVERDKAVDAVLAAVELAEQAKWFPR